MHFEAPLLLVGKRKPCPLESLDGVAAACRISLVSHFVTNSSTKSLTAHTL